MKKGITLVTLSTVVVVMVILLTTVTISGVNALNNSKKMKFASELVLIQEALQEYKASNLDRLPVNDTEITDANLPSGKYNQINMEKLGIPDSTYGRKLNGDPKDIYVVSKSNEQVYYLKGLKVGNTTYHTLTDELKKMIDYTDKNLVKDGIIFTQSNYEYTNQNIKLTIQVPTKYNVKSLIATNNATVSGSNTVGDYNVYTVTSDASNYTTVVTYNVNGEDRKQTYTVTNFDNTAPTIQVTNTTLIKDDNTINVTISTYDDLSGVDKVLYAPGNVPIEHFEIDKKGIVVTNNAVTVDKLVEHITFYVVDKAGNKYKKVETLSKALPTTEDEYVKYGLVLHYDGINNTGNGHSTTTRVWKDLSGNGNSAKISDNLFAQSSIGNGWDADSINIAQASSEATILQSSKFNNMKSFTIELKGNFQPNSGVPVYTRILSTNGTYVGTYEYINGIDLTYANTETSIWSYASDGVIENCVHTSMPKSSAITIVWDYSARLLYYYLNGELYARKVISIPNINCEQIALNTARYAGKSGAYSYNSVRVYNRTLTADEIKANYNIDKRRFGE